MWPLLLDVGGGSVKNWKQHSLARIPLRWMIRECFKMKTGIQFDAELLKVYGLNPATLYPVVQPRPAALQDTATDLARQPKFADRIVDGGTEEDYEVRDAQAEIVDQLPNAPFWWLLELLVRKVRGIYRYVLYYPTFLREAQLSNMLYPCRTQTSLGSRARDFEPGSSVLRSP